MRRPVLEELDVLPTMPLFPPNAIDNHVPVFVHRLDGLIQRAWLVDISHERMDAVR
jgi:hypothetical protein